MSEGKILIFGGNGFIGSHLVKRLYNKNHRQIIVIDIRPPLDQLEGVTYIKGDVRDLSSLKLGGPIQTIYNLAAVHTTPGHPNHEYYDTNVAGAVQITALARRSGCRDIVFTSSISVYGPGEDIKTEATPPMPESAYGWSKWLAEGVHRSWLEEATDRHLVICRPAVIFGQGEGGNFTRLAKLLSKGFFIFPGRRDTIKACFHVDDLLDSITYAHGLNRRYVLFNGSYPDRYTIEQIVEAFRTKYFPKTWTVTFPRFAMTVAANLMRPFSAAGLGIHPERIAKLVRSTDILPSWLDEQGQAKHGRLPNALARWAEQTGGRFD